MATTTDSKVVFLNKSEISNDDLFIRKSISSINSDSKVIIDETHVAIVLKDGIALETIKPGVYKLQDKNSPFSIEKQDPSRIEFFYISKTAKVKVLWGTPALFDIHDPITDNPAKMGANGEIELRVKNPRQFYLELVGVNKKFSIEDLKERLKGKILSYIEPCILEYVAVNEVPLDRIAEDKMAMSYEIRQSLDKALYREYGLEISSFLISNVNISDRYMDKSKAARTKQDVCPRCGHIIIAGSKFCNNCGARVE